MPNEISQKPSFIPQRQSIHRHIDLNVEPATAAPSTANRMDVTIANASASWAHELTPQKETYEDAYLVELMRTIDATGESPVDPNLPLEQRPTVFADEVPGIIADIYGWVPVPRAAPLNPKFIGNVPSAVHVSNDGGFNPGQLAA
ncbi:hypothetical protein [Stenotrophomonas oahuensis]|uniref:Uncharacterized protein n=1 Tax=Stenotrophomonas oahuensis TaxID=3003271 RepID=A0ABY9YQ56_9GAMM|nr:hypothetical protein [Stenotrophomonas sp. A5586]WNH53049.1 hypothetical protein PDM29_01905 [Stenotrophomonas sp. A5586]